MRYAIRARGLYKNFGDRRALDGVELDVPQGSVLGLIGPPGAGKSTVARILTTLLRPDAGTATVAGYDVAREPKEVLRRIGRSTSRSALDGRLTGRENLVLVGSLRRLGVRESTARAAAVLDRLGLTAGGDRLVRTYTPAMRRRLGLAASLLADPMVLFLDDPTEGLDPSASQALWQTVREEVALGLSVLLSTSCLTEADQLADRVAVLDHGRVVAESTTADLRRRVGGERLEVRLADRADSRQVTQLLARVAQVLPVVEQDGTLVSVPLHAGVLGFATASAALNEARVDVVGLRIVRPNLQDVLAALTGRPADFDGMAV
jgi:ABC-2 type transport system ATP-binding protein